MLRYLPHLAIFLVMAVFNFLLLFPIVGNGWLTLTPFIFQAVVLFAVAVSSKSKHVKQIAVSGLVGGTAGFTFAAWVFVQSLKHMMKNF